MNFSLTKEQEFVKQMVREFAENEVKPIAAEIDVTERFPMENVEKMAKYNMMGIPFSTEFGGAGGDSISYAITVEELSRVCATTGVIVSAHTSLCASPIDAFGTPAQKEKYLVPLAKGEKLGAFGLTEPNAGTDASGQQTTAYLDGDNYILNGAKCFITNAPLSGTFIVFALTDRTKGPKGLSAFIVEKDFPGISIGKIEDKCGIKSAQVSEVLFNDCVVPASNLVGKEGDGFKIAMKTLDGGRIGVAAQGLGIAEGAFEIAKEYMKERKQFGKPLFKQQYLAFKMAELAVEIEQAKYMLYKAAIDKQEGKPYSVSAAKAKLVCTDAAMHVTTEAIQMLGGNGYMREYQLERMMRDAKITQIYEGTNEIQKLIISGSLFR